MLVYKFIKTQTLTLNLLNITKCSLNKQNIDVRQRNVKDFNGVTCVLLVLGQNCEYYNKKCVTENPNGYLSIINSRGD